jgi:hypothetical protein
VSIGETSHHHGLLPAHRPADHDFISGPDLPVGLGRLAVHVHTPDFAGLLGLRAGPEEAGDVEPDI